MSGNGSRVKTFINCKICGILFWKRRKDSKYCSYTCSRKRESGNGRPKLKIVNGTKTCARCKELKPESEFSKDRYSDCGLKGSCKKCSDEYYKSWRQRDIDTRRLKDRINHYIRKYGFSEDEALEMVKDRTGICQICGETCKLVVDHCHKSGFVRGKICSSCNSLIGYSKERIDILYGAIGYLEGSNNELRTKNQLQAG